MIEYWVGVDGGGTHANVLAAIASARLAHFTLATPMADALNGAILFSQSEKHPCLHP